MKNIPMILAELEDAIADHPDVQIEPMRGDVWLLSSGLQKSIRRGETERALSAAMSLCTIDNARFWRRLHLISVEDIGVGDADVVTKTLVAFKATAWRKRIGELPVSLHIVRLLCEAIKCRLADTLYIEAERSRTHNTLRLEFAASDDMALTDFVLDENRALLMRVMALWYLAGTKRFPSDMMPQRVGSIDSALSALRALPSPPELTEASAGVISRTQWPLVLFTSTIWADVYKDPSCLTVETDDILMTPDVCGMPVYAADTFTRVGKSSIRTFQKSLPCFASFNAKQIACAIFYLDGGRINKGLSSPAIKDMLYNGELTEAQSLGLTPSSYEELQSHVLRHWGAFEDIREKALKTYMLSANT